MTPDPFSFSLDLEMDKLDRWAEDRRASLKATLDELDEALKAAKKPRAWPQRCRRSWNSSAKRGGSRGNATKPGVPLTRRAARSTARRTLCWTI
jgi:hypothetical protein